MANTVSTFPNGIDPVGYQQLTVSSTALGLTLPVSGVIRAVVHVEAQPIRWRDDGVDPTSSVGVLQKADTHFEINGGEAIRKFRAIKDDTTDAVLNVCYYK